MDIKSVLVMITASFLVACGGLPTAENAGISFPTKPAINVNQDFDWEKIGFAKEMVNAKKLVVVVSGGSHPIPVDEWDDFSPVFPWVKNIDRNLLFAKTAFLRSPFASEDCRGKGCFEEVDYKGYSWTELAKPMAVNYIPDETDTKKPEAGHVVIKTIKKCQVVYFEKMIYQLSDGKGNYYVMHASEEKSPRLDPDLPAGWTLKKVAINEPLILVPFGDKGDCYFNILGDNLGQGYHQYVFSSDVYP